MKLVPSRTARSRRSLPVLSPSTLKSPQGVLSDFLTISICSCRIFTSCSAPPPYSLTQLTYYQIKTTNYEGSTYRILPPLSSLERYLCMHGVLMTVDYILQPYKSARPSLFLNEILLRWNVSHGNNCRICSRKENIFNIVRCEKNVNIGVLRFSNGTDKGYIFLWHDAVSMSKCQYLGAAYETGGRKLLRIVGNYSLASYRRRRESSDSNIL